LTRSLRILGIDPGLRTTGFGLVEAAGSHLSYVASGTIKTADAATGDLPARLKIIFDGVCEVVERYRPDVASVEIVFVNVNPQSTLLLGQARGAALAALVSRALPVSEYTALQMKKAVVGHGQARKEQVQEMAMRLLALPGLPGRMRPTRWAWPSRTRMPASRSRPSCARPPGSRARTHNTGKAEPTERAQGLRTAGRPATAPAPPVRRSGSRRRRPAPARSTSGWTGRAGATPAFR
jgi:crossover junction endodeoxyribonuclease RuvC